MKSVMRCARLALLLLPGIAHAHVVAGEAHGFAQGMVHPFAGLDHVCAMIGVGLWAAQMGGRTTLAVPFAFVSVMVVGGLAGLANFPLPFLETGIVMSLLVLGLLIATAVRLSLPASTAIVSLFALFHGYAHGAEMPHGASGFEYALGFVLATVFLHACGIATGLFARRIGQPQWLRRAGVAVMLCGGGLWLAV